MLGLAPQSPPRPSPTPLNQPKQNNGHSPSSNSSNSYSSSTTTLSLPAIPEEVSMVTAPPGYLRNAEMARNIFPSYMSESDRDPLLLEENKSPEPVSYAKSIFSNRSLSAKKQGGKAAGKVVGKFRKLIMIMDEKAERYVGENDNSSRSVSSVPISRSISDYSISSGSSSDKDPWCLTNYLSSPDLLKYDGGVSKSEIDRTAAKTWGDIILKNLNDSKIIDDDFPSTTPNAPLPSDLHRRIKEKNEVTSRESSNSSMTVAGNSQREVVAELISVSGLEHPGLLVVPNSPEQEENMPGHAKHSISVPNPDIRGQYSQREISNMNLLAENTDKTASSAESTISPHRPPTPESMNSQRKLKIAVDDMWKHKSHWEETHSRSGEVGIVDHEENITQNIPKQLSWDIHEIHESIDAGTFGDNTIVEMIDELEEMMLAMCSLGEGESWRIKFV